jgi:transmembrane 9 superfamily protein 2/4
VKQDSCYISSALEKNKQGSYLFNHVQFLIWYHAGSSKDGHIVKASVALASCQSPPCTKDAKPLKLPVIKKYKKSSEEKFDIKYTYTVLFIQNDKIRWASRWDYILDNSAQSSVQWFSLINSVLITVFLSFMVGMILLRSLYRDIVRYNKTDNVVSFTFHITFSIIVILCMIWRFNIVYYDYYVIELGLVLCSYTIILFVGFMVNITVFIFLFLWYVI